MASFALWQATSAPLHEKAFGLFAPLNLPLGFAPLDPPARASPSALLSTHIDIRSRNHPPDDCLLRLSIC